MHHPRVSIIVRAFNEEKHIARLLECISSQETSFDYETLLVDSGSTDKTVEIATSLGAKIVRVNPSDFTFGYSLNRGIAESSAEFCAIISAHCFPIDDFWLQNLIDPLLDDKSVALVYGKQRGVSSTKFSEHQIFARWFPEESIAECNIPFCNNANSAIRRSLWEKIPFDEKLTGLEDIAWAKTIRTLGYKVTYKSNAAIFHVHEETPGGVFRRYFREGLAYREIFPKETFRFRDFLKFFVLNVIGDCSSAIEQRVLLKNLGWIICFRFMQFWGTYRGNSHRTEVSKEMQKQLYFPSTPEFHREQQYRKFEELMREAKKSVQSLAVLNNEFTEHKPPDLSDKSRSLTVSAPYWATGMEVRDAGGQRLQQLETVHKAALPVEIVESPTAIWLKENGFELCGFEKLVAPDIQKSLDLIADAAESARTIILEVANADDETRALFHFKRKDDSTKVIDITRSLSPAIAVWPGTPPLTHEWTKTHATDGLSESKISLGMHSGTHVDAPLHFVDGGKAISEVNSSIFVGTAYVVDCCEVSEISEELLSSKNIPSNTERLILKTENSKSNWEGEFNKNFAAITPKAARWLVEKGIRLIGIDGPSIQLFNDPDNSTHQILLNAEVIILEGLVLSDVSEGRYDLVALPLKITGAEASPVRAVLLNEGGLL